MSYNDSDYNDYNDRDDAPRRRPRRHIDFYPEDSEDSDDFGPEDTDLNSRFRQAPRPRRADDFVDPDEERYSRPRRRDYGDYEEEDYADDYTDEEPQPRRRTSRRRDFDERDYAPAPRRQAPRRDDYGPDRRRDDYDSYPNSRPEETPPPRRHKRKPEYLSDPDDMDSNADPKAPFRKRHPVLMNLIYMILASVALGYIAMWFLDYLTMHGQERVVPDVKGQAVNVASGNIELAGLRSVVTDSVFDSYTRPGTVVEQTPIRGAKIKKGGTVYLTIVAYSPKLVTVPDFYNVSVRQARSMFEGLGIKEVREVPVISEYAGLVLGAKFNGVALQPGAKIPISSVVTLEVGTGFDGADDEESSLDSLSMIIDSTLEELNLE